MHSRNATDVTLSYEMSTDLQTWNPVQPQLVSATAISFEVEQITVRFSTHANGFFARIRTTKNP